jgi:hypothetical protein
MKISRTVSFGMGAIMALVIGSGTAYAATGGKFILGKSNTAGKTTTLTNKNGTALSLKSKAGSAPLKVNGSAKVANLNADQLDGLDSSKFALAAGGVKAYDVPATGLSLDGDGLDEWFVAVGQCPAGTVRTGGGATDLTSTGFTVTNAPDTSTPNSWAVAVFVDQTAGEDPADVIASLVCYSPRGVPAGGYRVAQKDVAVAPSAALKAILSRKAH